MLSASVLIRRNGLYKGLLGGSRGWLILGALFYGGRTLRSTLGRSEELAATEVLEPGQFVTIRAIAPPTRKQRKAAKRARRAKPAKQPRRTERVG